MHLLCKNRPLTGTQSSVKYHFKSRQDKMSVPIDVKLNFTASATSSKILGRCEAGCQGTMRLQLCWLKGEPSLVPGQCLLGRHPQI